MTVTTVHKDPQALSMTIDAEFEATAERVWQLWADPRQLERWWGPPTYPATVTAHDLRPGGRVEYHMTGPEGDQPRGYWEILEADAPHGLIFRDGFANADGSPNTELPTMEARVTIEVIGERRTRMSIRSVFPSAEAMEQVLAMGAEEGMKQALGQIDAILAGDVNPHASSSSTPSDEGGDGQASGGPWSTHAAEETSTIRPRTFTLDVPGAVLSYDVRSNDSSREPALLLIGSPMGAAGFGTLAGHFTDRTVVTYDPRGVERSQRTDAAIESTPEEHADDLHRLITALGAGPVDIFASSGGAVNALAMVARHPEQVLTLVAHEPPAAQLLPDREQALAASRDVHETYLRSGSGPAMARFIALVSHQGPIPADFAEQPGPDPAMFGLPTQDDGSRDDPLLGQNMVSCTHYEPDLDALQTASTRIVMAAGATTMGTLANRAATAVAERLGTTPVTFPGGHDGFLGGEYGQTGEPDAFAIELRRVLSEA